MRGTRFFAVLGAVAALAACDPASPGGGGDTGGDAGAQDADASVGGGDVGGACTADSQCRSGLCDPVTGACVACLSDGDCADDEPCTIERCEAGTCKVEKAGNGAACDDGDACSVGDVCLAGVCTGKPKSGTTCNPVLCDAGAVPVDEDGDCCPDACECGAAPVCDPGTPVDTNGDGCIDACTCASVSCATGTQPVDMDGDGCEESCAAPCASACDCYEAGLEFAEPCPLKCASCGNYWACEAGSCVRQCGVVPAEVQQCVDNACLTNADCGAGQWCARSDGACGDKGVCKVRPQDCPDVVDPVCGCDGKTYGNACEAAASGANVSQGGECGSTCGGFIGVGCEAGEFCNWPAGYCDAADIQGSCVPSSDACPEIYAPVCGCDGKTYSNDCFRIGSKVQKDHDGACCKPLTCPAGQVPSDSDGDGCADVCNGQCKTNADCGGGAYCAKKPGDCAGAGLCQAAPEACTQVYDPVCGCDGKTWGNACSAASAGVNVAHGGKCEEACDGIAGVACGAGEFCDHPAGSCQVSDQQGQCISVPAACTKEYKPVCGCDGQTYANDCFRVKAGVQKSYAGACKATCDGPLLDCKPGYFPADTDGDGCDDTCLPACGFAIDCAVGYEPVDTDGDGCDDKCLAPCASACDCYAAGLEFAEGCPLACATCDNYWTCDAGYCQGSCGPVPPELSKCQCPDGTLPGPDGCTCPFEILCSPGFEPIDANGDGCADTCVPACNIAIKCAKGYDPVDTTGDGCPDSCLMPCASACECYEAGLGFDTPCEKDCATCDNYWSCDTGYCQASCGPVPAELEKCQCPDGTLPGPNGCGCSIAIKCAPGYVSVDTDGDGCNDSCKVPCADACDCYDSDASFPEQCALKCLGCGNYWACEGGFCEDQCGLVPPELEQCKATPCKSGADCAEGEYCARSTGACGGEGICAPSPQACPDVWKPVCGCDGKTYGNACDAAAAGVSVSAEGECAATCGGFSGEQCPVDAPYCDLPAGVCDGADIQGSCATIPDACPEVYAPVCGCDGNTYSNDCFRLMAKAQLDHAGACLCDTAGIAVPPPGNDGLCCTPVTCPPDAKPVDTDGDGCADVCKGGCAVDVVCPPGAKPLYDAAGCVVGCACADGTSADPALGCCKQLICPQGHTGVDTDFDGCPDTCEGCILEILCAPGTKPILDESGCVVACVCPDGQKVGPGGKCECASAIKCAAGYEAVDTDGDGCADSCKVPCADRCDCYGADLSFPEQCALKCLNCGNYWECKSGYCEDACGFVPDDVDACLETLCKTSLECGKGEYCSKKAGACGDIGVCSPQPEVCPTVYAPVCGCDGKTYSNACTAAGAGVNVASKGECQTTAICGGIQGLTCAAGQYCDLPAGVCGGADFQGKCVAVPQACDSLYDPVCGCDGKTYDNDCERVAAKAQLDHAGACKPVCKPLVCPDGSKAVDKDGDGCADLCLCADGSVAVDGSCSTVCGGFAGVPCPKGQYCELPADTCNGADFQGICVTPSAACPTVYKPVCGCDGKTYSNDCERRANQAQKAHDGACECKPLTCKPGAKAIDTDNDGCVDTCTAPCQSACDCYSAPLSFDGICPLLCANCGNYWSCDAGLCRQQCGAIPADTLKCLQP